MDILNFISWIKGGRTVTTVDPAKTLLPVGLKDNRRDDGYLAGAISVQDLVTQLTPEPAYKAFTALLTQIGVSNIVGVDNGGAYPIIIGATYKIADNGGFGWDFTNIGAPNNDIGTFFIATGTVPNSWGVDAMMEQDLGAPVVTVLENTIGNIWFTYQTGGSDGIYKANSNGLFTLVKTTLSLMPEIYIETPVDVYNFGGYPQNENIVYLTSCYNNVPSDSRFGGFAPNAIEIRVYN